MIWLSISLVMLGYVALTAAWQASADRWLKFSDLLIPRAMDVLIGSWLFFIGSSIGSFLNVVAWRMPRGVSVNGRSHCPWCDQTLSWKDNWPVFGWLALAGRCRTCRLPISPRYPIVELAVGLCILFVGWREVFNGDRALPFRHGLAARVDAMFVSQLTAGHLGTMVFHMVSIAVAWALGLVRYDGHRLPRSLVVVSLAMVIVPVLVRPAVAVVPWHVAMDETWRADARHLDAAMRVITGLAAAVVVGRALSRYLSPTADPKLDPLGKGTARLLDLITLLVVPGVVVGWQALLAVTNVALLIALAMPLVLPAARDPLARLGIALPIALTVQLGYWRALHQWDYWPSVGTAPLVTLSWAAAVLVLPACLILQTSRDRDAVSRAAHEAGHSGEEITPSD